MKSLISTCLAALLSFSASRSQSVVVFPSDHDPATQPMAQFPSNNYPLALGRSRVMVVYEAWDLNLPAGQGISRVGFRRHGTSTVPPRQLQLEVLMGPSSQTATTMSTTFANNYSAAPTVVFRTQLYAMPACTPPKPQGWPVVRGPRGRRPACARRASPLTATGSCSY